MNNLNLKNTVEDLIDTFIKAGKIAIVISYQGVKITIKASDTNVTMKSFDINVTAINDAPIISNISNRNKNFNQ